MKRLNKKAFTLVEILVAVAILAIAVVGIGSVIISTQNNTTKRLTEADLQQQVTEIKETLHNGLLSANLGVNCWVKEGDVYRMNGDGQLSTEQDKQSNEKIIALYNVDREDFVLEVTYYRWEKNTNTLSVAKTTKEIRENGRIPSNDQLIQIEENIQKVIEESTWSRVSNNVNYFNVRLENPNASQKLISVDLNVAQDKSVYPVNDTIYVRNEIKTNTNEFLVDKYTTITLKIPRIPENSPSVFTYDSTTHTPKIVDYYENFMTITEGSTTSASAAGDYYVRFELKDKKNYQWPDGTTTDKTIFWSIGKRTIYIDFGINTWVYDKQQHTVDYTIRGYDRIEEIGLKSVNQTIGPDVCSKTCTVSTDNPNFEFGNANSIQVSITPREASAVIDLHTRTWNGSPQTIATVGNVDGGTVKFFTNTNGVTPSKNVVTFSDCKETNANTYYVFYIIVHDDSGNYVDSEVMCAGQVEIKRAETAHAQVTDFIYNASPHTTNTSTSNNGVVWSGDITKTDAGTYTAYATPDSNHTWPGGGTERRALEWVIKKATGHIVAPVGADLTYNGYSQCLLATAASTNWGTVQYKVGTNGNWSSSIPYMTNAGDYTVYYYSTGDSNHEPTDNTASIVVKIKKANGDNRFKPHPSAKTGLIYNGSAQTLVNAGAAMESDAVIKYAVATVSSNGTVGQYSTYSTSLPTGTNAGKYRVKYYIDQANTSNYEDSKEFSFDVTIGRSPTAEFTSTGDKVYNEAAQRGYTYKNVTLGGNQTGTTVGTYTTTATPGSNYIWKGTTEGTTAATEQKSITWKITQRTNEIATNPTFVSDTIQYNNGTQTLVTGLGSAKYGTKKIEFRVKKDDGSFGAWQTTAIQSTTFGTYTIEYRAQGDTNHKASVASTKTIYVKPNAAQLITAPTAQSLTYTGNAQTLLTAGTAENGTFKYALSTTSKTSGFGNKQATIPTATNAGTYYVRYYIEGNQTGIGNWDDNKDGVDDYGVVTITIARARTATPGTGKTLTYSGSSQTGVTGNTYSTLSGHTATNVGSYTATATADSNHLFSDGAETKTVSWSIGYNKTAKPGSAANHTYDGTSKGGVSGAANVTYGGTHQATSAGSYKATVTPKTGYAWSDGTRDSKTISWSIAKAKTATAKAVNRTENKKSQCGVTGDYIKSWSGTTDATTYGTYTATATADDNHLFSDGSKTKSVTWTMTRKYTILVGDFVKIVAGSTYWNSSTKVPDWVIADQWKVGEITNSGARAVLRKNKSGKNDIQSPVAVSNLYLP